MLILGLVVGCKKNPDEIFLIFVKGGCQKWGYATIPIFFNLISKFFLNLIRRFQHHIICITGIVIHKNAFVIIIYNAVDYIAGYKIKL